MAETNGNKCGNYESIPYIAHESALARMERANTRLWIVVLALIALLVGTNVAWLVYESQFEDVVITAEQQVDGDGNNYAIGGDYNDPSESNH